MKNHINNNQRGFFRFFGYIIFIIIVLLALTFDFGNFGITDKVVEILNWIDQKLKPIWNFLEPYWAYVDPYWSKFIWNPWKNIIEPFLINNIGDPILNWLKDIFG